MNLIILILFYLILDLIYTQAYVNQQDAIYRAATKTKKHRSILFIFSNNKKFSNLIFSR